MKAEDKIIKETIYYSHNLIDFDILDKRNSELVKSGVYIPSYVLLFLDDEYFLNISDDVYKEISEHKYDDIVERTDEFIKWVEDNKDYADLMDKKEYDKLKKDLQKVGL